MNYQESKQILEEVKKANRILVNCHRGPDSDSVGSALGLTKVLRLLGKEVVIVCPSDIPDDLRFLSGSDEITRIDFSTFNFSKYDLFLAIDSSNYSMVTGSKELVQPEDIPFIVMDHHFSNDGFGKINLIDSNATSTGELLFKVFKDWEVKISSEAAECLLTGIIGDTGSFQYQNVGAQTLEIAAELIKLGADKDKIIYQIFRNISFSEIKIWGKIIENMQIDKEYRFVWSVIPVTIYKDFVGSDNIKEDAANLFFPIVEDTDFGIIMEEREGDVLSVSFRSRSGFDVSKIANEVGGGGHKAASGARIEGLPYDAAVEKVLAAARKHARK
ncbi:MAG TPA: bifunctional oligoribonuclease/PAP phosphatase NrnA [Patescibacteria group bacterium]|nr:bifunctional oligoribonuclease/PAP phosphatase NrnA [Patescibacteria group bacterium]